MEESLSISLDEHIEQLSLPQVIVDIYPQQVLAQYSYNPRETRVRRIIKEYRNKEFLVELEGGYKLHVALPRLYTLDNGSQLVKRWIKNVPHQVASESDSLYQDTISVSRSRRFRSRTGSSLDFHNSESEADVSDSDMSFAWKRKKGSLLVNRNRSRNVRSSGLESLNYDEIEESDTESVRPRRKRRKAEAGRKGTRRNNAYMHSATPTEVDTDDEGSSSHLQTQTGKKRKHQFELLQSSAQDEFSLRHSGFCDKCRKSRDVIPCQSCSLCLHEACLIQSRNQIIKSEDGLTRLRCFRCLGKARKDQSIDTCVQCHKVHVFSETNSVFRCSFCYQIFCWSHLPKDKSGWKCPDCMSHIDYNIDCILGRNSENMYLVKFKGLSFIETEWIRKTWLAGLAPQKKENFDAKYPDTIKEKSQVVKEEWCNIEICLDVKFKEKKEYLVSLGREKLEAAINQVEGVYAKWFERPYDDACWGKPPSPAEPERYRNFKKAYVEWVRGCYVELPRKRGSKPTGKFDDIEFKEQPDFLVGGKLMDYQLEGMNWLYYQWARNHPAILADEMGLGKTIQIIGLLATLHHQHEIWPFLVVAPNSTVPNWKREVEKWAPSLRVVALAGLEYAKNLIKVHELLSKSKGLKAHVVVTSYESVMSEIAALRPYSWQVLVVDEGQRLKNENSNLYRDLMTLTVDQRILLTGTPIQNNVRELLNLLQFLNPKEIDASKLEKKYNPNEPLNAEQITELHLLLKPFFLRRTKTDVLTFLPSKSEVIVPISMVSLQKRLYKSILEKNAELIRAIMSSNTNEKAKYKGSLNNIMMQLRKCLCHPYVYSSEIEEKTLDIELERRNLIGASGKLELLTLLLPKLKDKGHRVLIFSQFVAMLDVLEDFLTLLGMHFARIDGSTSSDNRQQAIDEYNRPGSNLFAFLLSTRAGGVGINLATADTIIIYDPDFNPHQDMQALARAHRIGQQKKVLVLKLVTKGTIEEKIIRIGTKKLVLDHLIIEKLDDDEPESLDLANILQFGARALFEEKDDAVVKYDDATVDRLLDRSIEEVSAHKQLKDANSFSFARIWTNDNAGELEEQRGDEVVDQPDFALWDDILKKREEDAEKQRNREKAEFAKGRRKNAKIDYKTYYEESPQKDESKEKGQDDDFSVSAEDDTESGDNVEIEEISTLRNLEKEIAEAKSTRKNSRSNLHDIAPASKVSDTLVTAKIAEVKNVAETPDDYSNSPNTKSFKTRQMVLVKSLKTSSNGKQSCLACGKEDHPPGKCPLRQVVVEQCKLCKSYHWTGNRQCPALNHFGFVKQIADGLKSSLEPRDQIVAAKKILDRIYDGKKLRSRKATMKVNPKKKDNTPTLVLGSTVNS